MTTVDRVVINVCNSFFVGEASLDSSSPDFVPSLFVYTKQSQTPKTKMERYNNKKVSYLSIRRVCFSLTQYAGLLAAPFF